MVGLTASAGIIGLIVLLTAFGYLPTLLRTGYTVTLYLDDSSQLRENSRVTLWGRDIGEVKTSGFSEPGAPGKTFVELKIDREVSIPKDVEVFINGKVFGGGPVIAMVGGNPAGQTMSKDGSAVIASATVVEPTQELVAASKKLSAVTEDISAASKDLKELKLTWDQVGKNINGLFGDGDDTPSLPRLVLGLEKRMNELGGVLAGADAWLSDEQLRDDVTQTVANAKKLTETLDKSVTNLQKRYADLAESAEVELARLGKNADRTATSFENIEKRYVALANEAGKLVTEVDKLVAKANSKDSTIGQLLNSPKLAKNLTDTSERLKLMTDEARLLIQKWRDEGVPLRVFD